jgi:putative transposase
VIGRVNGKKYKRVGIVAAMLSSNIIAPFQYEGTMDSTLFEIWFVNMLLPSLPPNTTIVMDRASFHRKKELVPLAETFGHRIIYLPPYSPELNDIENFWSWLKSRLRKILPYFDDFDLALTDCFNVG